MAQKHGSGPRCLGRSDGWTPTEGAMRRRVSGNRVVQYQLTIRSGRAARTSSSVAALVTVGRTWVRPLAMRFDRRRRPRARRHAAAYTISWPSPASRTAASGRPKNAMRARGPGAFTSGALTAEPGGTRGCHARPGRRACAREPACHAGGRDAAGAAGDDGPRDAFSSCPLVPRRLASLANTRRSGISRKRRPTMR